jgi:hypothetical protein
MRGVSCTQLHPMSNKSTIHRPTIISPIPMPTPNRTVVRSIKHRPPPSPIAQRHQRQRRSRSWLSVSPQCLYRTTNCRLETPRAVSDSLCCFYMFCLLHAGWLISLLRLDAFVHAPQGAGRWIIWYGLAVRLAWDVTAQYTFIPHAMRSWS